MDWKETATSEMDAIGLILHRGKPESPMSGLGHSRRFHPCSVTSAYVPAAAMTTDIRRGGKVPARDERRCSNFHCFDTQSAGV